MTQPNQPQTSQEQGPMGIKRYALSEISRGGEYWSEIRENQHGDFVKYDSYQSLQQKVSELEAENNSLRDILQDLEVFLFSVKFVVDEKHITLDQNNLSLACELFSDKIKKALKGEEK